MRAWKNSTSPGGRLLRMGLSCVLPCALLCSSALGWAQSRHGNFGPRRVAFHEAFAEPQSHSHAPGGQAARPEAHPEAHSGQQQHLTQWWATHRSLPPGQQADALRREPGFRNLPSDQQQRLLNRLQTFNQRSPEQQQRTLGRVEMFERLPPERQQEVRGASQALSRMSPDRQAAMRHAFQQLRQMPPGERQQMLNSTYGAQFSPQERTVLGNLLSIEPYQQQQIIHPYFGR